MKKLLATIALRCFSSRAKFFNFYSQFEYNSNTEYFVEGFTFCGFYQEKTENFAITSTFYLKILKMVKPLRDKVSLSILGSVDLRSPLIGIVYL